MAASNLVVSAAKRFAAMGGDPVRQDLAWRNAAGLPQQRTMLDVLARFDEEPKPSDVVAAMARDAGSLSEDWLEEHLDQYRRAVQVQALRGQLEQAGRGFAREQQRASMHGRWAEAQGPVAAQLERLTELAGELPEGSRALAPEANVDAGTTDELAETRSLLTRLGTMLGALPLDNNPTHLDRYALALVDVPDVDPAEVTSIGQAPLNPEPTRDEVQRACAVDVDLLLVDVARGEYPALSLRLAADLAEHRQRRQRVHVAHTTQVVEHRAGGGLR